MTSSSPRGHPGSSAEVEADADADAGANAGVPIPATRAQRKRSRMMQSSLDLVFSYTRSQHLHPALQSTPSFVGRSSPDRWISYGATTHAHARADAHRPDNPGSIDPEDPQTPDHDADNPSDVHSPTAWGKEQDGSARRRSSGDGLVLGPLERSPAGQAAFRQPLGDKGSTGDVWDALDGEDDAPGRLPAGKSKARQFSSVSPRHVSPLPSPAAAQADEHTLLLPASSLQPDLRQRPPSPGRTSPSHARRKSLSDRLRPPPLPLGTSTTPQTLFNATSVLVGLSLLSAPLAFSYAGWAGGVLLLLLGGSSTAYTAKLLGRLVRADPALLGYTDVASRAFGRAGGAGVALLFCLELAGLGVALLVLFGDSMAQLFPAHGGGARFFIVLGGAAVLPTSLMPLHLLSLPSLLSSACSLLLFFVILYDGLAQPAGAPGSLWAPAGAQTRMGPQWAHGDWLGAVGLILAGFGGHAIMPSLCRDMRHPEEFDGVVNKAFTTATVISFAYGAVGYLMFGNTVSDEVTKNLLDPRYAFPRALSVAALWMVALNPVTKFGLASRPLNVTIEALLRLSPALPGNGTRGRRSTTNAAQGELYGASYIARSSISAYATVPPSASSFAAAIPGPPGPDLETRRLASAERHKALGRILSRTVVTALLTAGAVWFPGFGRVMAFLGSFSAFLICIILPLLFYLRLEGRYPATAGRTGRAGRAGMVGMVGVSVALMVAGTAWAVLPHGGA